MSLGHDIIAASLMRRRAELLAYIWAITADEHIAEDVLQEVCRLAILKSDEIHDADHLLPWARTTARFVALNALRKTRRDTLTLDESLLDLLESHWSRPPATADADQVDALRRCLGRLSPSARRLVQLRYTDNISGSELAEIVGQKTRSVYTALSRIHRTLGDCIRRMLSAEASS
jgi:RNA polymerase sigma-70 factor (ECF subfamily)